MEEITLDISDFGEDSIGQSYFYDILYDLGFEVPEVKKARKVKLLVSRCNVEIFDEMGKKIEVKL